MIRGARTTDGRRGRALRETALNIVAVVGAVAIVAALASFAFGLRPLVFRSGSMAPAIDTGALALAHTVPAASLQVGDIVSVHISPDDDTRVTHRIVSIGEIAGSDQVALMLQGDDNDSADAQPYIVSEADRVFFSVPGVGRVVAWFAGPAGMFVLGLYAACLVRVLLRRRPDSDGDSGDDPDDEPTDRSTPRRGGRLRGRGPQAAAAVLVAGTVAIGLVVPRAEGTLAAWNDSVGTQNSSLNALTVPPPANFNCGIIGVLSVQFTWQAVPGATNYIVHYGPNGATQSAPITGTSAQLNAPLGAGTAWVTANRNFGSTTWTSAASNTRSYTIALASLCA